MQFAIPATAPAPGGPAPCRPPAASRRDARRCPRPLSVARAACRRRGCRGRCRRRSGRRTIVGSASSGRRDAARAGRSERAHPGAVDDLAAEVLVRRPAPPVSTMPIFTPLAAGEVAEAGGVPALGARRCRRRRARPRRRCCAARRARRSAGRRGSRSRARCSWARRRHLTRAVQPRGGLRRVARDAHHHAPTPRTAPSVPYHPGEPVRSERCAGEARSAYLTMTVRAS